MKYTKKPTIIFGGAFNPPTIAHEEMLAVCVTVARKKGADIWVLPSGERLDKTIGVPLSRRRAYSEAMIRDVPHDGVVIEINDYELCQTGTINTYDTARYFMECHSDREFLWVFGADSMMTMASWPGGKWLQRSVQKVVFERDDIDATPFIDELCEVYRIGPKGISSTELRRRLAANEPFREVVGEAVYEVLATDSDVVRTG